MAGQRNHPRTGWIAAAAAGLACAAAACSAPAGVGGSAAPPSTPPRDSPGISAARDSFTVVATGDIVPYPSIIRQAQDDAGGHGYDFRSVFAGVRPVVAAADLAICHLETVSGPPEGPFSGYPLFVSPPQIAAALRDTGYDSCSTASNHTLDAGLAGVRRTLESLDAAGVRHAGSARSAAEGTRPALMRAGGALVAQLSYTYATNGIPVPEGHPYAVSLLDPERVISDARAARRAGADVVLVSVHWGSEWQEAPDGQQLDVARVLAGARTAGRHDIDLIIGTHNHVPQAYEKVDGVWVVYGLGDQVANFPAKPRGNHGSIARFTFAPDGDEGDARWKVAKAEFLVQHSDPGPPFRVRLATAEREPEVNAAVRAAVLSRGAAKDGLTEGR